MVSQMKSLLERPNSRKKELTREDAVNRTNLARDEALNFSHIYYSNATRLFPWHPSIRKIIFCVRFFFNLFRSGRGKVIGRYRNFD